LLIQKKTILKFYKLKVTPSNRSREEYIAALSVSENMILRSIRVWERGSVWVIENYLMRSLIIHTLH
jgi:hypothetical protein